MIIAVNVPHDPNDPELISRTRLYGQSARFFFALVAACVALPDGPRLERLMDLRLRASKRTLRRRLKLQAWASRN